MNILPDISTISSATSRVKFVDLASLISIFFMASLVYYVMFGSVENPNTFIFLVLFSACFVVSISFGILMLIRRKDLRFIEHLDVFRTSSISLACLLLFSFMGAKFLTASKIIKDADTVSAMILLIVIDLICVLGIYIYKNKKYSFQLGLETFRCEQKVILLKKVSEARIAPDDGKKAIELIEKTKINDVEE